MTAPRRREPRGVVTGVAPAPSASRLRPLSFPLCGKDRRVLAKALSRGRQPLRWARTVSCLLCGQHFLPCASVPKQLVTTFLPGLVPEPVMFPRTAVPCPRCLPPSLPHRLPLLAVRCVWGRNRQGVTEPGPGQPRKSCGTPLPVLRPGPPWGPRHGCVVGLRRCTVASSRMLVVATPTTRGSVLSWLSQECHQFQTLQEAHTVAWTFCCVTATSGG